MSRVFVIESHRPDASGSPLRLRLHSMLLLLLADGECDARSSYFQGKEEEKEGGGG